MPYLLPIFIGSWGLYSIQKAATLYLESQYFYSTFFAFSIVALIFICHPLLDSLFNRWQIWPQSPRGAKFSGFIFWLVFPLNVTILGGGLYYLKQMLEHASALPTESGAGLPTWLPIIGMVISTGVLLGVLGINSAHEWIHRESKLERALGVITLMMVNFASFRINHVDIHHKLVATPQDPTTARKGENLYSYWIRSYFDGWRMAWRFESKRLANFSSTVFLFSHRMAGYILVSAIGSGIMFFAGGHALLIAWYGISLIAILLLQTVDYVEHYGLLRKELKPGIFEAVKPKHSWDSYTFFTNSILFNLGLHSHHHTRSQLHFFELRAAKEEVHTMKFGYSVMFLFALVPPLWRKTVDPMLD